MSETNGQGPDVLDMDAFWVEQTAQGTPVRIMGEVVRLPAPGTLPMDLERRLNNAEADDEEGGKALLGEVFGDPDLPQRWETAGMSGRRFQMLLVWALANGQGRPVTQQQALEVVDRRMRGEGDGAGEGQPNREQRRAAAKRTRSGGTGRSSKPTSPASTTSARTSSPS